jgi:hypothetical protein
VSASQRVWWCVGDLIGSGEAQERGIVGETPNLAARLQVVAEPNMVVIAESTRKLLGNLFEFDDLGAKELKGIGGPVRAWLALRARPLRIGFFHIADDGLPTIVHVDAKSLPIVGPLNLFESGTRYAWQRTDAGEV